MRYTNPTHSLTYSLYRRGVVVSGDRRTNEVNPRRARLVLGWVAVFGPVYHLGVKPGNQINSALHPSGVAKSSTSFGWSKGGSVSSAGWQVTLCDTIWLDSEPLPCSSSITPICCGFVVQIVRTAVQQLTRFRLA